MKTFSLGLFITLSLFGCKKEDTTQNTEQTFRFKVDGKHQAIGPGNAFSGGQFECALLRDTALFIPVQAPGGTGASIYIKKYIGDGIYELGTINKAYYNPTQSLRYQTNSIYTGTITIKKSTGFINGGGVIRLMEGTFSYRAIDTVNEKVVNITEGTLYMARSFD